LLSQAAEKVATLSEMGEKHSSGAEAHIDLIGFSARLKPCPDTKRPHFPLKLSFSAACETPASLRIAFFRNP
jgi:hypothetical protein